MTVIASVGEHHPGSMRAFLESPLCGRRGQLGILAGSTTSASGLSVECTFSGSTVFVTGDASRSWKHVITPQCRVAEVAALLPARTKDDMAHQELACDVCVARRINRLRGIGRAGAADEVVSNVQAHLPADQGQAWAAR